MVYHSRRVRAFTLVELLVVIGIIAVLLGILIPVLGKARKQANTAACLANQRHMMQAFVLYSSNWKGAVPWTNWGSRDPVKGEPYAGWLYNVHKVVNTKIFNPSDLLTGNYWPYLNDAKLYRCPGDTGPWLPATSQYLTTYVMNGALNDFASWDSTVADDKKPWHILHKIDDFNGDTAVMWEVAAGSNIGIYSNNDGGNSPDQGITIRHSKGTTISFIDGHAEVWHLDRYTTELNKTGGPTGSQLWRAPAYTDGKHTAGNPTYIPGPPGTTNFEYGE